MREFLDLLKNKRILISLFVLLILILGLLGGMTLIRQQQIIKSRATEVRTGVQIIDQNNNPITTTNTRNVKLKIFYTP